MQAGREAAPRCPGLLDADEVLLGGDHLGAVPTVICLRAGLHCGGHLSGDDGVGSGGCLLLELRAALEAPHIARVGPVQQRIEEEVDGPRDADGCSQGPTQSPCGVLVLRRAAVCAEVIAEGLLGNEGDDEWPDCVGDRILQSTLPSQDPTASLRRHDVREDGEVRAGLCPGAQQAEGNAQGQVHPKRILLHRHDHEDEVHQRDAKSHGKLCAERTAMQVETARQTIGHHAANDVSCRSCDWTDARQEADEAIVHALFLEEQRLVAHDRPGDGAKDALQDHHTERRHPEEF
mmetsp:Transcript_136298/g.339870  ORF Transcript_136298/g.339870 Transcript_136298/m.339870 type:complete len:291 (+) Transcript_136298:267-1139(+)